MTHCSLSSLQLDESLVGRVFSTLVISTTPAFMPCDVDGLVASWDVVLYNYNIMGL